MSALDVLRQIKLARKSKGPKKVVEWGNAEYINSIGLQNIPRRDLRNHLEARDLDTNGTRLELIERLRISLIDEQLHKFAYTETVDAEQVIQADLEERGSVYVAGLNDKGQLGLGDTNPRHVFTVIPQLRGGNVNYICAGMDMVFAVTDDHDVYVWGGGGVGRNGLNPNGPKSMRLGANNWLEPQLLHDLAGEEAIHISSGLSHNLACGKGGDCFVWGHGDSGQLGLGNMQHHLTVAVNNSFPPVAMTGCGSNHSMTLTRSGQLYSWGHAANGRLGLGAAERVGVPEAERFFFPVPALIATLEPIKMISCGADHTIAMGVSGAWSWGNGAGGRLGLGDQKDRYDPCGIPKLRGKSLMMVAAGSWHSLALVQYPPMKNGGMVYSWGSGYHGQLGNGPVTMQLLPETIEFFTSNHLLVKFITAGPFHNAAITRQGELYTWGSNKFNCLGRRIDERDVEYTGIPGHCGGFGAIVNKIGRGFPRYVACGKEYTVVSTFPYEGPNLDVAIKLMEESKLREEEANLQRLQESKFVTDNVG